MEPRGQHGLQVVHLLVWGLAPQCGNPKVVHKGAKLLRVHTGNQRPVACADSPLPKVVAQRIERHGHRAKRAQHERQIRLGGVLDALWPRIPHFEPRALQQLVPALDKRTKPTTCDEVEGTHKFANDAVHGGAVQNTLMRQHLVALKCGALLPQPHVVRHEPRVLLRLKHGPRS